MLPEPHRGGAMPAHLRVSVADRPGSLAALAAALSRAGANVLSVTVLERDQGRAVDDLIRQVVDQPGRALETVVDGLPHVLLADWAAAFDRRTPRLPVFATHGSPTPLPETTASFDRPRALTVGPEALIVAAVPDTS